MKSWIIFGYGSVSGFSLMLCSGVINFWLVDIGLPIDQITLFAFTALPYSISFFWSFIFDIKGIPIIRKFLSNYLSWLLIIEVILFLLLFLISFVNPLSKTILFAFLVFLISIFSSSQDSVVGAIRYKISSPNFLATNSGTYVTGYRLGMLIANSGTIFLSNFVSWRWIYQLSACFLLIISTLLIYFSNQYLHLSSNADKNFFSLNSLIASFRKSIKSTIQNPKLLGIVILIICFYRLGNEFLSVVLNYFFYQYIEYSKLEIASIGKICGVFGSISGSILATHIIGKIKIFNAIFYFGLFSCLSQASLIVHDLVGKNIHMYLFTTLIQSCASGMSMSAYIAFITYLCRGKFKALQYSFFSAFMGLSRTIVPSFAGFLVTSLNWKVFFIVISVFTCIITLVIRYLDLHKT